MFSIRYLATILLITSFATGCASVAHKEDLSGTYKVPGECAYRTESGEYESCVAWNSLTLQREGATPIYRFFLETNTFATTQGGCYLEGRLIWKDTKLVPVGGQLDGCHLSFEITTDNFVLRVPESERFESCKWPFCGHNSTLYSEPFPRNTREPVDNSLFTPMKKAKKAPNPTTLPKEDQ